MTTRLRVVLAALVLLALAPEASSEPATPDYLPDEAAAGIVTVEKGDTAAAEVVVLTRGVAIRETGPKSTVKRFGEVYAFSPATIIVHRDEPTRLRFWNLQPDDEHDVMLADPESNVLMKVTLPPLRETPYVLTFHRQGLFRLYCTMHQPAMSAQILVVAPEKSTSSGGAQ
jgi:plastocyanin